MSGCETTVVSCNGQRTAPARLPRAAVHRKGERDVDVRQPHRIEVDTFVRRSRADLAIAEITTDADLAIGPLFLANEPDIPELMEAQGFRLHDNPGVWKGSWDAWPRCGSSMPATSHRRRRSAAACCRWRCWSLSRVLR